MSQNKDKALMAISSLLGAISMNEFGNLELEKITYVIDSVTKNPDAVTINRVKMDEVWPDSEVFLGVHLQAYVLVVLPENSKSLTDPIVKTIEDSGVNARRIKVVYEDTNNTPASLERLVALANSNDCRAILCSKSVSPKVRQVLEEEQGKKTFEVFKSGSPLSKPFQSLRFAILRLAKNTKAQ